MRLTAAACCELSAAHSAQQIVRIDASNRDVEEVRFDAQRVLPSSLDVGALELV